MFAVEQERAHHLPPPPPPLSMDRIPPSAAYPTPGTGPLRTSDHLAPVETEHEGRLWSLQVVQQPIRARMCGFGDKVGNNSVPAKACGVDLSLGPTTDHPAAMHPAHCARCGYLEGNRYQVRFECAVSVTSGESADCPSLAKSIPRSMCSLSISGMQMAPAKSIW